MYYIKNYKCRKEAYLAYLVKYIFPRKTLLKEKSYSVTSTSSSTTNRAIYINIM